MRYAIYARYSDDNQNPLSIEDQVRICRERIAASGGIVAEVYADPAISGFTILNRPGIRALLVAARDGAFDAVMAEALDRISRDQEDTAAIFKRLTKFQRIPIMTIAEGLIDELHVGFKGTMNAVFLKDLAQKIRRGQRGSIEAGKSAGGLAYGYRVTRAIDAKGEIIAGGREIVPEQAAVVVRILTEYGDGKSAVAIAKALNRDKIPSPRGRTWSASAIIGNVKRGYGILHTEAYIGRLVYNRTTFVKDPDTGKRLCRDNPRSAWIIKEVPALRIVSDELWQRAQDMVTIYQPQAGPRLRRPPHLFAGLIVCGECGGQYVRRDADILVCGNHKHRGTCGNRRTVRLAALERRILDGLRDKLVAPDIIGDAVRSYHEARQRTRRARMRAQGQAAGRLKDIEARIARIVTAIEEGAADAAMKNRLMELGRERDRLALQLRDSAEPDTVISLHPNFIERYKARVASLREALAEDDTARQAAAALLRGMVNRITLSPVEDSAGVFIDLDAELEGLARVVRGEALPPKPGGGLGRFDGSGGPLPVKRPSLRIRI